MMLLEHYQNERLVRSGVESRRAAVGTFVGTGSRFWLDGLCSQPGWRLIRATSTTAITHCRGNGPSGGTDSQDTCLQPGQADLSPNVPSLFCVSSRHTPSDFQEFPQNLKGL